MKKVLFVCFVSVLAFISWKPANDVTITTLINQWNNAWNSQDDAAIVRLLDDNVQFIAGKGRLTGKDEVMNKFIKNSYKEVANLKTEKTTEKMVGNTAYHFGRYTHDVVDASGKVVGTSAGNFTFIWEKGKQNNWKITVIEIEEYPAKK